MVTEQEALFVLFTTTANTGPSTEQDFTNYLLDQCLYQNLRAHLIILLKQILRSIIILSKDMNYEHFKRLLEQIAQMPNYFPQRLCPFVPWLPVWERAQLTITSSVWVINHVNCFADLKSEKRFLSVLLISFFLFQLR